MELDNRIRLAVVKLAELGKDLLREELLGRSPLNHLSSGDERNKLEKLRFKEINSVEEVIRLLTGREFSLQWQKSPDGDEKGGFSLFEIMADAPRDDFRCWGPERRIDWSKGRAQGKIIKIYELIYNRNEKEHYAGVFLTPEFQTSKS